jgi:hypothetical protein
MFIQKYCEISAGQCKVDGKVIFSQEEVEFGGFSKALYQELGINYSKFFKMDRLSKLALLGASLFLEEGENTALLFANKSSSLDTDLLHQNSIREAEAYYPSPAVFVYTLPNICLGEISIKYKLYSENSFFVFENYPVPAFRAYADLLIETGKAEAVLCGWVEVWKASYRAVMYKVGKTGVYPHSQEFLKKII